MSEIMIEYTREIIKKDNAVWIKVLIKEFGFSHEQAKELAKEVEKLS